MTGYRSHGLTAQRNTPGTSTALAKGRRCHAVGVISRRSGSRVTSACTATAGLPQGLSVSR